MTRLTTTKRAALSFLISGALATLMVSMGPVGTAQAAAQQVDLWAVSGNTTLPGGQSLPVWGYAPTNAAVSRPGGPTIVVDKGDSVTITLHNTLPEQTSLLLQGQPLVPDREGVTTGQQKNYTFTADQPGTYLYEAGLIPNAQHQVAMGLYGALVVRPAAASRAYDAADTDVDTSFDTSSVLVLSEIDPALNNLTTTAARAAFDMRKYAPKYVLVNGKAYPDTDPIATPAASTVLLRYVNAGTQYRSMGVLGQDQTLIGLDGSPLKYARHAVAETFGPGQSADALVKAPSSTSATQLSVYDASLGLHNTNTAGMGGMLTTVNAAAPVPPVGGLPDTSGPATRTVNYNATTHALTAVVNDGATGGANVSQAEYFLDSVTTPGSGTAMNGAFGTGSVAVNASSVTIPSGEHILYVRGRDSATPANWGPVSSVLVSGADAGGPTTNSPTLTPKLTNHSSAGVDVSATGDDSASGGSNITAAEYFLDLDPLAPLPAGGSGTALTVNLAAPIASLDGTIPAATVNGLPEGPHVVSIRSKDAGNNWGALVTVELVVDTTGPGSSGITVSPSPSNGLIPFAGTPAIRVMAQTLSDPVSHNVNSTIKGAEVFIDTVGATGTGIVMSASDGLFNDAQEGGYADIPLTTIRALSSGSHTVFVHAKDAAGNWGATNTGTLVVDKAGPTVSALGATAAPQGAPAATLTATATDALSNIGGAEWFTGTDPGPGNATPMTVAGSGTSPATITASVSTSAFTEGSVISLKVRARDAAGNWGAVATTSFTVTHSVYFSTLGSTNPPGVAGTADDADIYYWNGSTHSRSIDVSVAPYSLPASANVDGYDRVDSTHFYLSFTGSVTIPRPGPDLAVDDEDIVFYNAGTWSVFFDGSAHGLTNNNHDLDAISIVGGTVYFSTVGNSNPPGVGGAADDADIYSYNPTTFAYARVWDASANGLAAAANVDGFVRVDATHFYLSFGADAAVPGLGTVQDEDVVYNNAGTWSVFFNGTAHGLTSVNLDVDAFDVP